MLRALGRLLWIQTKEIQVCNFPHHYVLSLNTHKGVQYILLNKSSDCANVLGLDDVEQFTKNLSSIDENVPNLRGDKGREGILQTQRLQ